MSTEQMNRLNEALDELNAVPDWKLAESVRRHKQELNMKYRPRLYLVRATRDTKEREP